MSVVESIIAALLLVGINFGWELRVIQIAKQMPDDKSLAFLLKWNGVRILGLMCVTLGVILLAHIRLIPFMVSFMIFYSLNCCTIAFRYGKI